jgi:hypothetical protein
VRATPRIFAAPVLCALLAVLVSTPASSASWSWRRDAVPSDIGRVQALPIAWQRAIADARARGFGPQLARLGELLDPRLVFDRAEPPPGVYHCRTIRIGAQRPATSSLIVYPWYQCRVSLTPGGDLQFAKITGTLRTSGNLYPDSDRRLVYLGVQDPGTAMRGAYGPRTELNQAGVLERIGPRRWRLALPFPRSDSLLDVIDIVR